MPTPLLSLQDISLTIGARRCRPWGDADAPIDIREGDDGRAAARCLPARRQQHGSNQQQAAEAETQATFGQSMGESDPCGDRRRATECQWNTDEPLDLPGGGVGK